MQIKHSMYNPNEFNFLISTYEKNDIYTYHFHRHYWTLVSLGVFRLKRGADELYGGKKNEWLRNKGISRTYRSTDHSSMMIEQWFLNCGRIYFWRKYKERKYFCDCTRGRYKYLRKDFYDCTSNSND